MYLRKFISLGPGLLNSTSPDIMRHWRMYDWAMIWVWGTLSCCQFDKSKKSGAARRRSADSDSACGVWIGNETPPMPWTVTIFSIQYIEMVHVVRWILSSQNERIYISLNHAGDDKSFLRLSHGRHYRGHAWPLNEETRTSTKVCSVPSPPQLPGHTHTHTPSKLLL